MEASRIHKFLKDHYNLSGELTPFASYDDLIYRVDAGDAAFILKIYREGYDVSVLSMQMALIQRLAEGQSVYEIPSAILDTSGVSRPRMDNRYASLHPFLSGKLMADVNPILPSTRHSLGEMIGTFHQVLHGIRIKGDEYIQLWDNAQIDWIADHLEEFGERRSIIEEVYEEYREQKKEISHLRKSVIYNDANEYNLFVRFNDNQEYTLSGAIDFGDSIYTQSINDIAIAIAYAMMDLPDPLAAAADIIRGYHEVWPLEQLEIKHLYLLVKVRLINSLAHSSISAKQDPDNEYISVHTKPTWDLLERLGGINDNYAHYYFRAACGWGPVPQAEDIINWISQQVFFPIYGTPITLENSKVLDLSVGSTFIGSLDRMTDTAQFSKEVFDHLDQESKTYGIGRYDEIRLLYREDNFGHETNNGPAARTLHIGLDVFAPAHQAVHAPLRGTVIVAAQNDLPKDYGHVIILEHKTDAGTPFYTLYGHLCPRRIRESKVGDVIEQGQIFAWLGDHYENGDWVPHVHFQVITDLLGNTSNYPGVADPQNRALWLALNPDPNLILGIQGLEDQAYEIVHPSALMDKRKRLLPRNLSVSFRSDPLHIVRGDGVYLYDHDAQAYLDTVNNVAHVGHENSTIVKAGQEQMAILNTNTRYLHPAILEYADALVETLPDALEVVYFCNSGSEANDLAMRLARAFTDVDKMVILEQGYHGHTQNCIDVSSYKFESKGGRGQQNHIIKLDMPDRYRGLHADGESYLNDVDNLLNEHDQIGGFIGEAILSCGGQIVPPTGYMRGLYDRIRAKGGVCIADEVQTGFGRIGEHFWAFELHDVVPDIVTMGKPIGNGHPLAAVVTTRAIADAFDNGMEYFNTFGGNPVSCTIGHAVLKYIQDHDLQSHAKEVGDYLIKGLKNLQARHRSIGDVRGHGLFLGIEMVEDADRKIPSQWKADYIIKRMKEHKIQMSTDGPDHNVIKIKPPMLFNKNHADRLLTCLAKILDEDYMKESAHL